MKQEEEKLKKKYPNMKAGVGGSALLSKRLQKVQVNQILRSNKLRTFSFTEEFKRQCS